jgi:hypothetical protein
MENGFGEGREILERETKEEVSLSKQIDCLTLILEDICSCWEINP